MFQVPIPKICELKRRLLLQFFINHFLEVAKKCFEYESYDYALLILERCRCLAILLGEEPSGEVEARPLKLKIFAAKEKCDHKIQQIVHRTTSTRQTRGVQFDLPGLNDDKNIVFERKNRPNNIKLSADITHQPDVQTTSLQADRPESDTTLANVQVHYNLSHENDDSEIETTEL